MNINSTLIVQMANVVVAYILFDFILVKPLARIMQQEDAMQKQLLMTIQQAQDAIQIQELEFQRQKREWRLRLMAAVPSLSLVTMPEIDLSLEKEPELEITAFDRLIPPLAQYMIKKAEDECITHQ